MVFGACLERFEDCQGDDGDEKDSGDLVIEAKEFALIFFGILEELEAEVFE